jgi:hypothetical protein
MCISFCLAVGSASCVAVKLIVSVDALKPAHATPPTIMGDSACTRTPCYRPGDDDSCRF